jgi:ribonuclease Z
VLYSSKRKLKPELAGRSQAEIREAKLAGAEVTDELQIPEIAFTGDTTIEFLAGATGQEDWARARLLFIEMSFLDDLVPPEAARAKGHMHLDDFLRHAHKLTSERIVFIHFSPRYRRADVERILGERLPPGLRERVVPWLNGFD